MRLILLSIFFFLSACITEEGCQQGIKEYGSDKAYFVLHKKPWKTYVDYTLVGKDLTTDRDTTILLGGRWYENLDYIWDTGDTVIKNQGELTITIRKRDNTVHTSEWTCESIYLDGKSVSTGLPKPK